MINAAIIAFLSMALIILIPTYWLQCSDQAAKEATEDKFNPYK